ncbi:serine hydrolase domain-containing protein [Sandaracinobacter neustonicus]|nr:serine hydrolase domain-containing protein [Sandaracinobacter neustonicus]
MGAMRTAFGLAVSMLTASAAFAQGPAAPAKAPAIPPQPVVAAATAAPANGAHPLTAEDVETFLDGFVPIAMSRGGIIGTVVVVVKDGKVLVKKGYGLSDLKTRKPVDPDATLFRPGSVSKLFTWTAVMQQVEAGKIDLDADVNTYLDFKIPPRNGKPITMRDVMTHTPGFEEAIRGLITANPALGNNEANLKRWTPKRVFDAGTTPAYSNYATGLAGYIVERVSGLKFDDYIDQKILGPLQMHNSSFRQPLPDRLKPMMSTGYLDATKPPVPYEIVSLPPAGSLAATGTDMGNFMIAHLQNGKFGDGQIMKPETAIQMHETARSVMAPLNNMRLGFYQQDINGQRVITHGGDTMAFHSLLTLFLDQNVGLFQSVNTTGVPNGNFRQALFEAFADRYFPAPNTDTPYDPKLAAAQAKQIAGTYVTARGAFSNWAAVGSLLGQPKITANADGTVSLNMMKDGAGFPKRYAAIGPFLWREVGGHDRLGAKLVDGKVRFVSTDALSAIIVLEPVRPGINAGWLTPAAGAAVAALLGTVLLWPVAAIVRRRFGKPHGFTGQRLKSYRAVRISAILLLAVAGLWTFLMTTLFGPGGMEKMMAMDWLLITTQVLTNIAFVGGLGVALWHLWAVFKGPSGWFGKLWSVVLVLAFAVLLWFAWNGKLLAIGTNF